MKESTSELFGEMKPYFAEMIETAGGAGGGGTAGGGAVAASLLAAHVAEVDPHTGYRLESVDIPLTTDVTGKLPEVNGGTNQDSYATGDMLYASAANTLAKRAIGSTDHLLTVAGGVPTWASLSDTMHGGRGGGALHDSATNTTAGFMTAAHVTQLEALVAGGFTVTGAAYRIPYFDASDDLTTAAGFELANWDGAFYSTLVMPARASVGGSTTGVDIISGFVSGTSALLQLYQPGATSTGAKRAAISLVTNQTDANGNDSTGAGSIGDITWANAGLGTTEKRVAMITVKTDGATNSGYIGFWTASAGTMAEAMRIRATGAAEFYGNVTITKSLTAVLSVISTASAANLTCTSETANANFNFNAAGQAQLNWQKWTGGAASARWLALMTSTAEGGSNAGSNWQLLRRTDAGASLGQPVLAAERATGYLAVNRAEATAAYQLDVSGDFRAALTDAVTNAVSTVAVIGHDTSGTAAAGFGARTLYQLESSTTAAQDAGAVDISWSTATHASRAGVGKLYAAYTTTLRECLAWGANSSVALIGFYGTAPVAKPTVTGSRAGNAALASLLTALAGQGLLTDSSS